MRSARTPVIQWGMYKHCNLPKSARFWEKVLTDAHLYGEPTEQKHSTLIWVKRGATGLSLGGRERCWRDLKLFRQKWRLWGGFHSARPGQVPSLGHQTFTSAWARRRRSAESEGHSKQRWGGDMMPVEEGSTAAKLEPLSELAWHQRRVLPDYQPSSTLASTTVLALRFLPGRPASTCRDTGYTVLDRRQLQPPQLARLVLHLELTSTHWTLTNDRQILTSLPFLQTTQGMSTTNKGKWQTKKAG